MNAHLSVLHFVASVQPLFLRKFTKIQQKQHNPAYLIMKFTPNPLHIISDQEMNPNHNIDQEITQPLFFKVSKMGLKLAKIMCSWH